MSDHSTSGGGKGRRLRTHAIAVVCWLGVGMLANGQVQPRSEVTLTEASRALEAAVRAKDIEGVLALWHFGTPTGRTDEETALRGLFSAGEIHLTLEAPLMSGDGQTAATAGTLMEITEPRGSVEQWGLLWKKTDAGWRITTKQTFGGIDGLVHLELQANGYVANGQSIELEDFSLKMLDGTFFMNTQSAGPTSLVFVGKGRVTFKPRPVTERGQMKIFTKSEIFEDEVSRAFLRLHPADLYRTLQPGRFVEDPKSAKRLPQATQYFDRHKTDAFVLDAPVAGAPWWLLPGLGDASIAFETEKYGPLTLAISSNEAEGISLFNRATQRQISTYPRANAGPIARDAERALDVHSHDLALTLNPENFALSGRDTIAIDIRSPITSFRFQLDNELGVRSVRSQEGGPHLFFRVRGQNSVLVSMGSLAGRTGRLHLTVEYAGRLPAGTVESELLQVSQGALETQEESPAFFIDPALIYSKRRSFYPHFGDEDYATSALSVTVPATWNVVSGGVRQEKTERGLRTITHRISKPAKYLAFAAGRFLPFANEKTEALAFEAWGHSRTRRESARLLNSLKSAANYYVSLFGPLPYQPVNLALIEAPVPGGHSPPGFIVLQQRPPLMGGGLKDDPATFYDIPGFFLAHELAHQWWGHGVTPRSYRDRWVSEAFAQYAAALWVKEAQGGETFNRILRKFVTWSRRLTESGPVDLGNRVGHIRNDAQAHRAVVYNKGALILDMVRRLIGDDAFRRAVTKLQTENRFQPVDSEMVRRAFEAEGGTDFNDLWEVFVRNTPLPTMRLEGRDGAWDVVVDGFADPLPVTVRVDNERRDLVVTGRLRIPGTTSGSRVVLDPDGVNLVPVRR